MVIVSWHSCLFFFLNRMGGEQIIEFIILTNLFFFLSEWVFDSVHFVFKCCAFTLVVMIEENSRWT